MNRLCPYCAFFHVVAGEEEDGTDSFFFICALAESGARECADKMLIRMGKDCRSFQPRSPDQEPGIHFGDTFDYTDPEANPGDEPSYLDDVGATEEAEGEE